MVNGFVMWRCGSRMGEGDILGGSFGSLRRGCWICGCFGLGLDFEGAEFGGSMALLASWAVVGSDCAVAVDLLAADCGCAHGGVGSVTGAVDCGCCVAFEGLTSPVLVLFLPAMVVAQYVDVNSKLCSVASFVATHG